MFYLLQKLHSFFIWCLYALLFFFFFFNDTATTEIYTLPLHDALPICLLRNKVRLTQEPCEPVRRPALVRSEEHTSELQSPCNLVCRLLLEKKKKKRRMIRIYIIKIKY